MNISGRWYVLWLPWKIWGYPLAVAVLALVFAVWVAGWKTLDWPAEPLIALGFEVGDSMTLLALSGVVVTGAAILTGVGELYEAMPPQHVTVGVWEAGPNEGGRWRITIAGRNGDTFVAHLRIDLVLLDALSHVVHRVEIGVDEGGEDILPERRLRGSVLLNAGQETGVETIRLEWATDRRRGVQHVEIPFAPVAKS